MAKKTTPKSEDSAADAPIGNVTEEVAITPPPITWPESTENRELGVKLTDEEIVEQARAMIEKNREVAGLLSGKKASAKEYDAQIETAAKEAAQLSAIVTDGAMRREVGCRWLFEVNGFDKDTGAAVPHSEMKTLVREDTGEVVEIKPITTADRQMNLPLAPDNAEAVQQELVARGYTVREAPNDAEHQEAFEAVSADQLHTFGLAADSRAAAEALAVKILQEEPAEAA